MINISSLANFLSIDAKEIENISSSFISSKKTKSFSTKDSKNIITLSGSLLTLTTRLSEEAMLSFLA